MKSVQRCVALAQLLVEQNFPAIGIHRGMPQEERYRPPISTRASLCIVPAPLLCGAIVCASYVSVETDLPPFTCSMH